jgi:hypothetical protein
MVSKSPTITPGSPVMHIYFKIQLRAVKPIPDLYENSMDKFRLFINEDRGRYRASANGQG